MRGLSMKLLFSQTDFNSACPAHHLVYPQAVSHQVSVNVSPLDELWGTTVQESRPSKGAPSLPAASWAAWEAVVWFSSAHCSHRAPLWMTKLHSATRSYFFSRAGIVALSPHRGWRRKESPPTASTAVWDGGQGRAECEMFGRAECEMFV